MTFPELIIAIGVGFFTSLIWYWIIRSAVANGIVDARKKIAKERDELRVAARSTQRPSKATKNRF